MKKLIILAFLTLPAYANVEICNHQYCMDWPEYCVKQQINLNMVLMYIQMVVKYLFHQK